MNYGQRQIVPCATALVLAAAQVVQAAWSSTTYDANYNDPANWAGGIIDDQFTQTFTYNEWNSAPGFSFTKGTSVVGSPTVTGLGGNGQEVSQLYVGMPITSAQFPVGTTVISVDRAAGTVTLSNNATAASSSTNIVVSAANNPWRLQLTSNHVVTGGMALEYSQPVNLAINASAARAVTFTSANPSISVDVGPGAQRSVTFNSNVNFDLQNKPLNISVTGSAALVGGNRGDDTLSIQGSLLGLTELSKSGAGTVQVSKPVELNGPVKITGGNLQFSGNSSLLANSAVPTAISIDGRGSQLLLQTSAANSLGTSTPITMRAGVLTLGGGGGIATTVGAVTLTGSKNTLANLTANEGSNRSLTLASLTRENQALLNLIGRNGTVGNGSQQILVNNDAHLLSGLVGGGGSAGTSTISILPWVSAMSGGNSPTVGFNDTAPYSADWLVTYTSDNGFRALTAASEYQTDLNAASAVENVRLGANVTLGASKTVNALTASANANITLGSGLSLTITSGVLNTREATISGGSIAAGTGNPLIFGGRSGLVVNSSIGGDAGIIVANVGSGLTFGGTNTYSGDTLIMAQLQVNNAAGLPAGTNVRVDEGGTLRLGTVGLSANSLSGTGVVQFVSDHANNSLTLGTAARISKSIAVGSGGYIAPGDPSGEHQAGTLSFTGTAPVNLALQSGSELQIDLAGLQSYDSIANLSSGGGLLTIDDGLIKINRLNGYLPEIGDTFNLITGFTGTTLGSLSVIDVLSPSTHAYGLQRLDNGTLQLTVTAVPEPALVSALGVMAFAGLRRRR